jgi:hypothetical protein
MRAKVEHANGDDFAAMDDLYKGIRDKRSISTWSTHDQDFFLTIPNFYCRLRMQSIAAKGRAPSVHLRSQCSALCVLALAGVGALGLVAQSTPVLTGAVTASGGSCPTLPSARSLFLATDSEVWFDFTYNGGSAGDVWFVEWYAPDGSLYTTEDSGEGEH